MGDFERSEKCYKIGFIFHFSGIDLRSNLKQPFIYFEKRY